MRVEFRCPRKYTTGININLISVEPAKPPTTAPGQGGLDIAAFTDSQLSTATAMTSSFLENPKYQAINTMINNPADRKTKRVLENFI